MADFLNVLLDVGVDRGVQGGPDDFDTQIAVFGGGQQIRNQGRAYPLGEWQLGNRNVDRAYLRKLLNYWKSFRGTNVDFLYRDWMDCLAEEEPLVIDGGATAQLIVTYGGYGNDYVRTVRRPMAGATFIKDGMPLTVASVSSSTGLVTFDMPYPLITEVVTWSGGFYKRAHFNSKQLSAQFLEMEERADGSTQAFYNLGSLVVQEQPDP